MSGGAHGEALGRWGCEKELYFVGGSGVSRATWRVRTGDEAGV